MRKIISKYKIQRDFVYQGVALEDITQWNMSKWELE